jgi:hypothetical protein
MTTGTTRDAAENLGTDPRRSLFQLPEVRASGRDRDDGEPITSAQFLGGLTFLSIILILCCLGLWRAAELVGLL